MDVKYLVRWIDSPIPGRRQKAIYQLGKLAVQGKYEKEKALFYATKLLEDDEWRVRATAISTIRELLTENISQDLIRKLMEIAKNDSHPNVRANSIIALSKMSLKVLAQNADDLLEISKEGLEQENNDIRHAALYLLFRLSLAKTDIIKEFIETLKAVFDELPPLLKKENLQYLKELYLRYADNIKEFMKEITQKAVIADKYYVVEAAMKNLALLIKDGVVEIDNDLMELIKRKLRRNNKPAVILAALEALDELLNKDIMLVDKYMDILINELLLSEKNKRVKIRVLEIIQKYVDKIPRDIVYKYGLPRALDIIDMNTVPKNEELAKIKNMARHILEDRLGYNYELRQKLRQK